MNSEERDEHGARLARSAASIGDGITRIYSTVTRSFGFLRCEKCYGVWFEEPGEVLDPTGILEYEGGKTHAADCDGEILRWIARRTEPRA